MLKHLDGLHARQPVQPILAGPGPRQQVPDLPLQIEPRLPPAAIVEAARLIAVDLLAGRWIPREATAALYRMYVASGYASELADFSGFDDYYDMLRDGIVTGSVAALDEDVMRATRYPARGVPASRPGGT